MILNTSLQPSVAHALNAGINAETDAIAEVCVAVSDMGILEYKRWF